MKNNVYKLQGKVQHYQWGGVQFLPQLLQTPNPEHRPFAEYWLGAHSNAPSSVHTKPAKGLDEYITADPSLLGPAVAARFGRLPYLFKVLDVKDMLSIQVHPSKRSAEEAFEKENKAGVPLNAAHRNYKDDNHKPELMVALGDFYLLHGFRTPDRMRSVISGVPELNSLFPYFEGDDYKRVYSFCMEMEQPAVNTLLQPLLDKIIPLYQENKLSKEDPHFWAARAALTFNGPDKIDKGIFSIYLLNLVYLKEGEAVFQDAGVLHAYLEGQNMEIMANSDNVLRGGLTPKHIDVPELMKHISFHPTVPQVIHGTKNDEYEEVYRSPAPDFELSRFSLHTGNQVCFHAGTTEILIVMKGSVQSGSDEDRLLLRQGESAVAFAGAEVQIEALDESIVFRASVPV